MQVLFDYVNAFLIGGTIFFIIAAYQFRGIETAVDDNVLHITRQNVMELASILEQDIIQLPHQLPVDSLLFDWPVVRDSNTTELTFYIDHLVEPALIDTTRKAIRYELVFADSVDNEALYEMRRSTCTSSPDAACVAWMPDGSSAASLRSFQITPLDGDGIPSSTPEATAYFEVRFSMAPLTSNDSMPLNQMFWGTTLRIRP